MAVRARGKADFMVMLVWLIIIGVIGGVLFTCWANLRAANDPSNKANYWDENMYTYRSEMEDGDRLLEQGRYADARAKYEEARTANSQSESSIVLLDRVARAHFREAEALRQQSQWSRAIDSYRAAETAVGRVSGAATNVRSYRAEFQADITDPSAIGDGLVACLVAEAIARRDEQNNAEGALPLLTEARERQPANLAVNRELIELHRQRQDAPPLLEAMRHFLDRPEFPPSNAPQFGDQPAEYQELRARIETAHLRLQNHILETSPVEQWVPMIDGLVLLCHMEYSSPGGSPMRGEDFTRTMRMRDANTALVGRDPNNPQFIYSWQNLGGMEYLVEEWTSVLTQGPPVRFALLPRQPRMGAQWRNFDGTTWQITDLVFDPSHQYKLLISGYQLGPMVLTMGVGRTSNTPLGSYEGEFLDDVQYPSGAPAAPATPQI